MVASATAAAAANMGASDGDPARASAAPAAQPGVVGAHLQARPRRPPVGLADVVGLVVANAAAAKFIGRLRSLTALRSVSKAVSQAFHAGRTALTIAATHVPEGTAGAAEVARFLRRRQLPTKLTILPPDPGARCAPEHV